MLNWDVNFSMEFLRKRNQMNFLRIFPLEVFTRMVRNPLPPFFDGDIFTFHSSRHHFNYVRWLFLGYAFERDSIVGGNLTRFSFNEFRMRVEAFLLAYYNLWLADDEYALQCAFNQYEQFVRLDFKETSLTVIERILTEDFPRNLSFMQMNERKHLSRSQLCTVHEGKKYLLVREDQGHEKFHDYFLHPDLTFSWAPNGYDFRLLKQFLTEGEPFHFHGKTHFGYGHSSTWIAGYKYSYVLEGTLENKRLIDTMVAEYIDRKVSVMKPSFESFIRELRSRFFSDENLIGNSNRELNHVKDEPLFQIAADPAWKAQSDTLSKIEAALGNDFNLFYNDRSVQKHLPQLLNNPNLTPYLISTALKKWRMIGSPTNVSPFAELIKSLIG